MSFVGGNPREEDDEGEVAPSAEVVITPRRDDAYRLVGDPEVLPESTADRLAQGVAEAGAAIAEARRTARSDHDELPAGGSSLWWPDRTAQVVQATHVKPSAVGAFLTGRIGQPNSRLRITSVAQHTPSHVTANALLRVRGTGWRRVTVTIYPTPSANLTVMEMMPRRAWMWQTKRYLSAGVPAITELKSEIEAA